MATYKDRIIALQVDGVRYPAKLPKGQVPGYSLCQTLAEYVSELGQPCIDRPEGRTVPDALSMAFSSLSMNFDPEMAEKLRPILADWMSGSRVRFIRPRKPAPKGFRPDHLPWRFVKRPSENPYWAVYEIRSGNLEVLLGTVEMSSARSREQGDLNAMFLRDAVSYYMKKGLKR